MVMYGKTIANVLGKKDDKIRRVSKKKLYDKKLEGIAKLCMVSVDKVKEIVKSINDLYFSEMLEIA